MASIVALSGGTTLGGSYCAAAVETNRTKVREADRKSTRLNSSQGYISYAVFCLKKKKKHTQATKKNNNQNSTQATTHTSSPCLTRPHTPNAIILQGLSSDLSTHRETLAQCTAGP